ncbi:tripartite motif-containing protein 44 [Gouania willdenowi]|uniref:B box-type domain-containing protein n=1 Tax=Gouania willdenowi TaxID=441366 RepID=A0A8C5EFE8_GOUWI|nr:tripartite motif-containing protein 44 [Gouania willdenowi]
MERRGEELPQMDGSCDACEPDEAQPATQVCCTCNFAFCVLHAENHTSRTKHPLIPYKCEEKPNNGACTEKESRKDENESNKAAGQEEEVPIANGNEGDGGDDDAEEAVSIQSPEQVGGAEAAEAKQDVAEVKPKNKEAPATRERLHCKEHDKEGTLYCKCDEKIICVMCAVQGEHRDHEIITLHEAYLWQKSKGGYDLLGFSQRMGDRINEKWVKERVPLGDMEKYVNDQFQELCRLVRLEEKRFLHLVDLKEAFFTAAATEKIAEINLETEKLQEEMAIVNRQISILEQAKAPADAMEVLLASPRSARRALNNVGARLRLPEPRADPMNPRDLDNKDSGPSMDHAP